MRFLREASRRGRGCGLLLALSVMLVPACERQASEPAGSGAGKQGAAGDAESSVSEAARKEGAAGFVPPQLPDTHTGAMKMALEMRIAEAYHSALESPDDAGKLAELAALYYVHGFPAGAAQCLEHVVELEPEALGGWYCLGLAYERAGQAARAVAAFERVIVEAPEYGPAYVHLADLVCESDPARAAELYQHVMQLAQTDVRALHGLGRALQQQGKQAEARAHLRKAVGLAPEYADAQRALAEVLTAQGDADGAARHRRQAEAGSALPELTDSVALAFRRSGWDAEVVYADALLLAQQGEFERAEGVIGRARRISGAETRADEVLGVVRAAQGRYEEAAELMWQVLEVEPDSIRARSNLGAVLAELGQVDEAEQMFRAVLARRPDHAATVQRFVALMRGQGRPDEPVRLLEELLTAHPENVGLRFQLAQLLMGQQQPAKAIAHLRQVIELCPELIAAWHYLGLVLREQGDAAGAQAAWLQILEIDPKYVEAYLLLSRLAYERRHFGALAGVLRRGLEQLPESPVLANTLAWRLATWPEAEHRNGAEAVTLAERCCEQTGRGQHAYLDTLGAAYAEVGRFEEAAAVARRATELAVQAGDAEVTAAYRSRLELYLQSKPYHESAE